MTTVSTTPFTTTGDTIPMSLMDIADEVAAALEEEKGPRCVIGKALRLIEQNDPTNLPKAQEWIAGSKPQPETAEILSRYVTKITGIDTRIAAGSVGNHKRKGCVCP